MTKRLKEDAINEQSLRLKPVPPDAAMLPTDPPSWKQAMETLIRVERWTVLTALYRCCFMRYICFILGAVFFYLASLLLCLSVLKDMKN